MSAINQSDESFGSFTHRVRVDTVDLKGLGSQHLSVQDYLCQLCIGGLLKLQSYLYIVFAAKATLKYIVTTLSTL